MNEVCSSLTWPEAFLGAVITVGVVTAITLIVRVFLKSMSEN